METELLAIGAIDLSPLISECFSLESVNDALDALESGRVARPMIDMQLNLDSEEAANQTRQSTTTVATP